jgi:hypothetical protein
MGQMIRQVSPNITRYYWYPGDKKEWLRALLAFGAGGAVFGLSYLLTKSLLAATVLGLAAAAGIAGFNLGRRDLRAVETLNGQVTRREVVAASGRSGWRGLVEGGAAAFAALVIVHLSARGFVADWLLPVVPGVVGALARQAGLLSGRLIHESVPASMHAEAHARANAEARTEARTEADTEARTEARTRAYAAAPSRRPHSTDAVGEPGAAV